jgi:hypothetical protein
MTEAVRYSSEIEKTQENNSISLTLEQKLDISSLALLISKKILTKGSYTTTSPVIEIVLTPQRIQQIINEVGVGHLRDFVKNVFRQLQPLDK